MFRSESDCTVLNTQAGYSAHLHDLVFEDSWCPCIVQYEQLFAPSRRWHFNHVYRIVRTRVEEYSGRGRRLREVRADGPQDHSLLSQLHHKGFVVRAGVKDAQAAPRGGIASNRQREPAWLRWKMGRRHAPKKTRTDAGDHPSGHELLRRIERLPRGESDRRELLSHLPLEG